MGERAGVGGRGGALGERAGVGGRGGALGERCSSRRRPCIELSSSLARANANKGAKRSAFKMNFMLDAFVSEV